jgi:hypothetical protein
MLTLGQAARLGTVPVTGPAVRHATPGALVDQGGDRPICPALQREHSERRWRRPGQGGHRPSGHHPSQAAQVHADRGRGHLASEASSMMGS